MRIVKGFHATLPVACEHLRASRGSTFPTGPTHTGLPSMQIPTGELGYIPHLTHCQSGSNAPLFQGETGGSPRVTRAPCALKPPSDTSPPPPPPPPLRGETGGSPRVTRAPCALKPPSYTSPPAPPAPPAPPDPPAPSTARARAAIACDSSVLAVIPYTAGPHELCPTPAAPQSRSRSTISPV